jgi:hypothetical protein
MPSSSCEAKLVMCEGVEVQHQEAARIDGAGIEGQQQAERQVCRGRPVADGELAD